jgi:hypothetical protein
MKLLLAALVLLAQGAAFAQENPDQSQPRQDPVARARFDALFARIQDFQRRHTIRVNGSENPGALPRGAVLTMFFAQRGPSDDAAFSQFALERYGATGPDAEALKETRDVIAKPSVDICANVLDGSLSDGMSIAKYITRVNEESDRDVVVRYQGIFDKLSPRVRANVLQKIDEYAVGVSGADLDNLGMAQEDPDLYKTMMNGLCRGKKNALAASPPTSLTTGTNHDPVSTDGQR